MLLLTRHCKALFGGRALLPAIYRNNGRPRRDLGATPGFRGNSPSTSTASSRAADWAATASVDFGAKAAEETFAIQVEKDGTLISAELCKPEQMLHPFAAMPKQPIELQLIKDGWIDGFVLTGSLSLVDHLPDAIMQDGASR
jgi:hypothetical protein